LLAGARIALDQQRKRLDAARSKYMLLRRKMETEFAALDSLGSKVAELEALRKVGLAKCMCCQRVSWVSWGAGNRWCWKIWAGIRPLISLL